MYANSLLFSGFVRSILSTINNNYNVLRTDMPGVDRSVFLYSNELSKVENIINNENEYKILIIGSPGSGKTTFLQTLCNSLNGSLRESEKIRILSCISIPEYINWDSHTSYDFFDYVQIKNTETPLLIDEIETLNNPNGFIEYLTRCGYKKLIVTSRRSKLDDKAFDYPIDLIPSRKEIIDSIMQEFTLDTIISSNMEENPRDTQLLKEILELLQFSTARELKIAIKDMARTADDSIFNSLFLKNRHLLYQYGRGVDISSEIILPERHIITPHKDIVTDVTVLDKKLLQYVKNNPSIIDKLSPREFEEMICDLLDAQGFKVELTKQTRDGGKDIIVTQKSIMGDFCIYVECKKYDKANPVRVKLVRELYGTVMADNVTAGLMITTSYYTKDAREFRETVKNRIMLKDYQDLAFEISRLT